MARQIPTGCSPEQRGQRDRRISTKSHRPTGGETHPVKHWHAKQYQQTYGHCAGHIPRRVFVTSPRSCASERTQPPRAIRSSANSRSITDDQRRCLGFSIFPLPLALFCCCPGRPQTGRSAGPIPHSNPQCRRAPRTACSICDSASLSQPRPRQWKARTSARSEVSCMRCRRPRRTGCTPSNPALIGGTSASVRCSTWLEMGAIGGRPMPDFNPRRRARQSAGW